MLEQILKYQALDMQLRAIEVELGATEERKKARALHQKLKDSEEDLKKMDADAIELNAKYEGLKAQYDKNSSLIKEYLTMVDKSIDEDELNYLSKKFADLNKTMVTIEKEIAVVSAESDKIVKKYDEYKSKIPAIKKQYAEAKECFEALRKSREGEIIDLQREKGELEKTLDADILKTYKELKTQEIKTPFVTLEGTNRCGGCRMEITMRQISALENAGYCRCENCHRVIYKK